MVDLLSWPSFRARLGSEKRGGERMGEAEQDKSDGRMTAWVSHRPGLLASSSSPWATSPTTSTSSSG